jgi:hypothetical protein
MNAAIKQISLEIPASDMSLIETIAKRLGWRFADEKKEVDKQDFVRPEYSERIQYLRSLRGKGITQKEIDEDERLKYLLSK